MNSVTGTNVLNGTMIVSGLMVGALAAAHTTCLIAGLSAKVGAVVADRLGCQDAAEGLKELSDIYVDASLDNIKTDLKVAGFFAAVGFGAYFAQFGFASANVFDTHNVTQVSNNSTFSNSTIDSNFTNIDTFGFNSSNSSFFGNNMTNRTF